MSRLTKLYMQPLAGASELVSLRTERFTQCVRHVQAEKFPMSRQANAVLFTQERSCCFSMCFILTTTKKVNKKKEKPSTPFMNEYAVLCNIWNVYCIMPVMYRWLRYTRSCWGAPGSDPCPWDRFGCCALDGALSSPSTAESHLEKAPVTVGEWLQKCVPSCHPHRIYRTDACQWWLWHLGAGLHVFYQETISWAVLRHGWASGHGSCHIYCWGVWINDQMTSAGCTTLTWNCQLHCECPTAFPSDPFFHSGPAFRRINMCFLIFKPRKESKQKHWEFLSLLWWL